MNTLIKGTRIVFPAKQMVCLEAFELEEPQAGQIAVQTEISLMSTGTENIVFNRLFDSGTHFDKWVTYPFYPGYSAVGRVIRIGREVQGFTVGDRVACRPKHTSHALLNADECLKVPPSLPSEHAVWFALAKIALHGTFAADYVFGDRVVIIGAGPIGQMAIRWARVSGVADLVVVDPLQERAAAARSGGATTVITANIADARQAILEALDGLPPRIVVDSTGNAQVFHHALELVGRSGKVVLLGDTGTPGLQALTPDVVTRGISIIGAHDGVSWPEWDQARIGRLFLRFAEEKRFDLDGMISHRYRYDECPKAYAMANQQRASTMGIIFDWREAQ